MAIIFDTETTGLPKSSIIPLQQHPKIIEFAAIKIDDTTLEEVGRLEFLCNPKQRLDPVITKLTGIKDSDLVDKEELSFYWKQIGKLMLGEKYIIAHNAAFDTYMLKTEFSRLQLWPAFPKPMRSICTVNQTLKIKGYRLKLGLLYEHLTGKIMPTGHRAMIDVEALTECVRILIKKGEIKIC